MGLDVMSDDYLVRKQAVLEYKILYFFSPGLNHVFVQNWKFRLTLFLNKLGLSLMAIW